MKKKLVVFLLIGAIAFSFATPAMATTSDGITPEMVNTTMEHEITPFTEMTRIYLRTYNGNLQWRLWSITNGRWLTDWANV